MLLDKDGKPILWDGPIKTKLHDHSGGHGVIQVERTQVNRDAILAQNLDARKNNSTRKLDWGLFALQIPELDLMMIKKRNPDLDGPEPGRTIAWKKFMRSSESIPYRVINKI